MKLHPAFLALSCLVLTAQEPSAQAILARTKAHVAAVEEAFKHFAQSGQNPRDFHPDFSRAMLEIEEGLKTAPKGESREALLVSKLLLGMMGAVAQTELNGLVDAVKREVPARSMAWGLEPDLFAKIATPTMLEEALAASPVPSVKASALGAQGDTFLEAGKLAEAKAVLARLEKDYAQERVTDRFRGDLNGVLATAPGAVAPAFSVASLEDPKQAYSLADFKGKYLLIDFWATWCGPCRREMPHLHQAWERFKGKNFEILSLSFDRKADDVAPFRRKPGTPMPWKHAFVEGGFESPLGKAYGVNGIPKPVLVGPDGKVVASGEQLRGENLEKTLEKYLK